MTQKYVLRKPKSLYRSPFPSMFNVRVSVVWLTGINKESGLIITLENLCSDR
jgi:hypothetical protein